ncbi:MAG TPA: hypothetical protein VGR56_02650 [Nitrososphaerales archaeon]|nr:hypothetical protein [Nitrososphaerales archaeon]
MAKKNNESSDQLPWIVLFAIGITVIVSGGWNYITALFGAALSIGSLVEVRSIRISLRNQTQSFKAERISFKDSNVIQNMGGEIHIHQDQTSLEAASKISENEGKGIKIHRPEEDRLKWSLKRSVDVDDYIEYRVDLEPGDVIRGSVDADDTVSIYILSQGSFRSYKEGYEFRPLWEAEGTSTTEVFYKSDDSRRAYIVIDADNGEATANIDLEIISGEDS